MKKIAIFGGSNPAGKGYQEEKSSECIYPNLLQKHGFDVENISVPGIGYRDLFIKIVKYFTLSKCDIAVIEWNSFFRHSYNFYADYNFHLNYHTINEKSDIKKLEKFCGISNRDFKTFFKVLRMIDSEYGRILDIIDFCNTIVKMAKYYKTDVVMLSSSTIWPHDIINYQNRDLYKNLSKFSRIILDFDNRDDHEIVEMITKMQQRFQTLDQTVWIDLFKGIREYQIDNAPLDEHPGPKTHQIIANRILHHISR